MATHPIVFYGSIALVLGLMFSAVPGARRDSQAVQPQAQAPPQAAPIGDGCDVVANPIPNCKEEVAKLLAAEALLPKRGHQQRS
jgi:hypothetical protein